MHTLSTLTFNVPWKTNNLAFKNTQRAFVSKWTSIPLMKGPTFSLYGQHVHERRQEHPTIMSTTTPYTKTTLCKLPPCSIISDIVVIYKCTSPIEGMMPYPIPSLVHHLRYWFALT